MKKLYTLALLAAGMTFGAQAQVTSPSDLAADYLVVYAWGLNNMAPEYATFAEMTPGEGENEVLISNLFSEQARPVTLTTPVKATLDVANQTLTVASGQTIGTSEAGATSLFIGSFVNGNLTEIPTMVGEIDENGNVTFPENYFVILTAGTQGYWFAYVSLSLMSYKNSTVKVEDYIGDYTGSFSAWDNYDADWNYSDVEPDNYDGLNPTFSKGTDKYELLINNLFPFLGNFSIRANVLPNGNLIVYANQEMYMTNEDIWILQFYDYTPYDNNGVEEEYGYSDFAVIYLEEGKLYFSEALTVMAYSFANDGNEFPFNGAWGYFGLSLDPQFEIGGVEEISHDINAPIKYYNLQGLEVKEPQKGQLVIKKQGNQVSKLINR